MHEGKELWIRCELCGFETSADLINCACDDCGALEWSEPYEVDNELADQA